MPLPHTQSALSRSMDWVDFHPSALSHSLSVYSTYLSNTFHLSDSLMSDKRQQLSADEVKAQRAAKAAEKAARVQAAALKKEGGVGGSAGAVASSANASAAAAAPVPSANISSILSPSNAITPKHGPVKTPRTAPSPALTPSHSSVGTGLGLPPLSLDRRDSVVQGRERSGSGGGGGGTLPVKSKGKEGPIKRPAPLLQFDDPKKVSAYDKKAVVSRTAVARAVPLFSHLPQYERETSLSLKLKVGFSGDEIHPAILRLGLQYASGSISGSNARCVAMLTALQQFIVDYHTPPSKSMRDDLLSKLKPLVRFLIDARPQSLSMGNAIRYVKMRISKLPLTMSESRAKDALRSDIDVFIQERIEFADEVIASHGASKISDGDVVLTYATSHVVEMLLTRAHAEGKRFRVIVVDSRPKLEGKELLCRLLTAGIQCTYILINALSYVMKDVSKVFLGAASLLSNGAVIARVGTAVVAMTAKSHNVPVLVCCETYKFHERVQLDSIGFNELGDPDELILSEQDGHTDCLAEWRDMPNLKLLNLVFDLTPVEFVTMVISEVGMIPPTSVPVILREYSGGANEGGE
jgi:translation initiation factor eIF-2B subunit delta